jgi:hypothetical protein
MPKAIEPGAAAPARAPFDLTRVSEIPEKLVRAIELAVSLTDSTEPGRPAATGVSRGASAIAIRPATRPSRATWTTVGPAVALVASLLATRCSGIGVRQPNLAAAKRFGSFPLYSVGPRFEKWNLTSIEGLKGQGDTVSFIYGDCTPRGGEQPSCAPPLEIQIAPLCSHLAVVAQAPVWKRRRIRGAPVGEIDSSPVLFSRRVQVKVYRGEGSDRRLPMRALRALRSINRVPPVVGPADVIPSPAPGVLEGTRRCTA